MRFIYIAFFLALSFKSIAQPDLVISAMSADTTCYNNVPAYSLFFTATNLGADSAVNYCFTFYTSTGAPVEICPSSENSPIPPGSNKYFSLSTLNYGWSQPFYIDLTNVEGEVVTSNNSAFIVAPDQHNCSNVYNVDFQIDSVGNTIGCDQYGAYWLPEIHLSNQGLDDITEFCMKFQILGQFNDTVCFTGQSYLPLAFGDSAIQYWPKVYASGVLSIHLLHVNGVVPIVDWGFDEAVANNMLTEVTVGLPDCPSGCIDELACNFDPVAIESDDSCWYAEENYDCDGNVIFIVEGCIDYSACNYDEGANTNDGSCEYPELYYNCDGSCANDIDGDLVCDEFEVPGCMNEDADNFDPFATDEDGSCEYTPDGYEVIDGFDFGLRPNPVYDILNVSLPEGSYLEIYSMSGALVVARTTSNTIDVSGLPNGLYEVIFVYDGIAIKKKIMKL